RAGKRTARRRSRRAGKPDAKPSATSPIPRAAFSRPRTAHIQGYNAQAAVDGAHQVIVAHGLTAGMSDQAQLVPLVDGIKTNLGRKPKEASADSGYLSEANLAALEQRGIKPYIATGPAEHPADAKCRLGGPLTQAMRRKLKRAGWRSRYRLRKQMPAFAGTSPVFGQIKQGRGFRQFLAGVEKVRAEWAMICTAHNLAEARNSAMSALSSLKLRPSEAICTGS
ncbi:MAG: transposase, partial [Rhodospirillales bacterium]|nr:transposase [Rhodospirillales bacterium]